VKRGKNNLVKQNMAKQDINHLLVLIGGIIMIVQSIWGLIGLNWWALISLLLGLVAVASTKVIDIKISIPFNGPVLLVIGILGLIFAGWLGAILILIAAVLILLNK
jgi:hypothetical protein